MTAAIVNDALPGLLLVGCGHLLADFDVPLNNAWPKRPAAMRAWLSCLSNSPRIRVMMPMFSACLPSGDYPGGSCGPKPIASGHDD